MEKKWSVWLVDSGCDLIPMFLQREKEMDSHLSIALSAAVPLHIMEIKKCGGVTNDDLASASKFAQTLGEKGDVLLFGSKKKGEVASLFNRTAKTIAILSFLQGGITIFGGHYESNKTQE